MLPPALLHHLLFPLLFTFKSSIHPLPPHPPTPLLELTPPHSRLTYKHNYMNLGTILGNHNKINSLNTHIRDDTYHTENTFSHCLIMTAYTVFSWQK